MEIRLLVLRTSDPKQLSEFYGLMGLQFDYHKHGNSPWHYTASLGHMVLEIYPLAKDQQEPDKNLRLGLAVDSFEDTVSRLHDMDITFVSQPVMTDFGFMAIVADPDGRKIELYKK